MSQEHLNFRPYVYADLQQASDQRRLRAGEMIVFIASDILVLKVNLI